MVWKAPGCERQTQTGELRAASALLLTSGPLPLLNLFLLWDMRFICSGSLMESWF